MLTGNTRYRANWRGKLILQVEFTYIGNWGGDVDAGTPDGKAWRDARVQDLSKLTLKGGLTFEGKETSE